MLYWILYPLREAASFFNLFGYITFRAAGATFTAMLVAFAAGPAVIGFLRKHQIGQTVRDDGPQSHLSKEGTPTMGGLLILVAVLLPVLLWGRLDNRLLMVVLISTIWMGLIGLLDDYLKVIRRCPKGLVGRYKLAGQFILGLAIGIWLCFTPVQPGTSPDPAVFPSVRTIDLDSTQEIDIRSTETTVPFIKSVRVDLGLF